MTKVRTETHDDFLQCFIQINFQYIQQSNIIQLWYISLITDFDRCISSVLVQQVMIVNYIHHDQFCQFVCSVFDHNLKGTLMGEKVL